MRSSDFLSQDYDSDNDDDESMTTIMIMLTMTTIMTTTKRTTKTNTKKATKMTTKTNKFSLKKIFYVISAVLNRTIRFFIVVMYSSILYEKKNFLNQLSNPLSA